VPLTQRLTCDVLSVWRFVHERTGLALSTTATALGQLDRAGVELQIGVIYESYNGANVWMHVAALPGTFPMRDFVSRCFSYAFDTLGVQRITGWVAAGNTPSRRLVEHLGFRLEATLQGAEQDGDDALIYVMRREDCRVLRPRPASMAPSRCSQET
jgi:hypothetical protein